MEELTADTLGETLHEPKLLLLHLVLQTFGQERTAALLKETLRLESEGGMLVRNKSRRRTPGGVFFHLAREAATGKERRRIFGGNEQSPTPQIPAPAPPSAEDIRTFTTTAPIGEASVKVTLIGRPDLTAIQTRAGYVAFRLRGSEPPSLPRGLPPVPAGAPLTWLVAVAERQWSRVKDSLAAHPNDKLILEGYPIVAGEQHILLVQSCTSAQQQREKQQKQQASAVTSPGNT